MKRNILQVPLSEEMRESAKKTAEKQRFSSLQDAVRFFLQKLAEGKVAVRLDWVEE